MHKKGERLLLILAIVLGALTLGSILMNYTGFVIYPRGGFVNTANIGAGGSLSDWYYRYSQVFDFIIFLTIFLGINQMIFGEHFKNVNKSLVVGVGVFLSLALVLWESRTNTNLFELFGPFALVILILFILVIIYKQLKIFGGAKITAVAAAYILFYVLFFIIFDVYQAAFFDSLRYFLPFDLFSIASIGFAVACLLFVLGLFGVFKPKGGNP